MANDGHPPSRPDGTNHGVSRSSGTHPDKVRATTDTMWKCAQLRAAGATFREIGETLDIDPTWARTLVLRALEASKYEAADLMRVQEGMRLDRLMRAHYQQALRGEARHTAIVLRVMEQRAKLFGLNAPVQVEVSGDIDRQIRELDAQLSALAPVIQGELAE